MMKIESLKTGLFSPRESGLALIVLVARWLKESLNEKGLQLELVLNCILLASNSMTVIVDLILKTQLKKRF